MQAEITEENNENKANSKNSANRERSMSENWVTGICELKTFFCEINKQNISFQVCV